MNDLFWYIVAASLMFLLGMLGGAVIAKLDRQEAERQRRQEPVRCWNYKL